jgi:hypothetical protein
MTDKTRSMVPLFNLGASFAFTFIAFLYFGVCVTALSSLEEAASKAGQYASYYSDSLSTARGTTAIYGVVFAVALCASVFGIIHAYKYVSGEKQKTPVGFVSSIASILLSGFWMITIIIGMAERNSAKESLAKSGYASVTSSFLSAEWMVWVLLIFTIVCLCAALTGLVVMIKAPQNKAQILEAKEDTTPIPNSVVNQFAKPEKKDLPPMLGGDTEESTSNSTAISGMRTIMPTGSGADATEQKPEAQDNTGENPVV